MGQKIVVSTIQKLNLSGNDIVEVDANASKGFNFPFFLFIPETIDRNQKLYLLVEPNNTGRATDDFDVHRQKALNLVKQSYAHRMAKKLRGPLLVPVFPRPATNGQTYTHALDRDSLEIDKGQLKRLDLQLVAMIDHAIELLHTNGFKVHDQVFMHGFSASAKFCNRFAFLHPKRVKAVASGGVNGLPMLPISNRKGYTLPFPIGIADIETITGQPFDKEAHQRVAQYIYMGYLDRNDTLPSREAWSEDEADLIKKAIAAKMMPDRWRISQAIYQQKLPCAQCVTYNGVTHTITDAMENDLVKFFRANSGNSFIPIEPHAYDFIEYREIHKAHINAVYSKSDRNLPKFLRETLREDRYLIGIKEWIPGQSHRQLETFVENAGFNFHLRADGHPEIIITEENYNGTSNKEATQFQVFHVKLDKSQLKALIPGVPYTLHPKNKSDKYVWMVEDGVRLIRPTHDMVLAKLDSTFLPSIEIDTSVQGAIAMLNKMEISVDYAGIAKPIYFHFRPKPEQQSKAPNIRLSARGLSVMEVLLIICRRTSLEYRIEGTTVYIENKK